MQEDSSESVEGGYRMLFLNVSYGEKDEAKVLGAKWNPECKKWYVENKENYPKFAKWISEQGTIVVCDGEELEQFRAENIGLINENMIELAEEFASDPEELIGMVLQYRIDRKP